MNQLNLSEQKSHELIARNSIMACRHVIYISENSYFYIHFIVMRMLRLPAFETHISRNFPMIPAPNSFLIIHQALCLNALKDITAGLLSGWLAVASRIIIFIVLGTEIFVSAMLPFPSSSSLQSINSPNLCPTLHELLCLYCHKLWLHQVTMIVTMWSTTGTW